MGSWGRVISVSSYYIPSIRWLSLAFYWQLATRGVLMMGLFLHLQTIVDEVLSSNKNARVDSIDHRSARLLLHLKNWLNLVWTWPNSQREGWMFLGYLGKSIVDAGSSKILRRIIFSRSHFALCSRSQPDVCPSLHGRRPVLFVILNWLLDDTTLLPRAILNQGRVSCLRQVQFLVINQHGCPAVGVVILKLTDLAASFIRCEAIGVET